MSSSSLWHEPNRWIGDPLGYVFLPRAMLAIGEALYPNDWTGTEPVTPVFLPLSRRSAGAREWEKREAHIALCVERPDLGRKPLEALPQHSCVSAGGFSKGPPIIPPFTDAEWQAARAVYRRREVLARPAWDRYSHVRNQVIDACRQRQLAFGLRPRAGGAVYPGKHEWWETEGGTLLYRFEWFRMSSIAPFASGLRDDADWICIERGSLDSVLKRLGPVVTARDENDAARYLAGKLRENPDMTQADARAECKTFDISKRGFRERIWPKAREMAGLPATASAGRKRKNRST